MEVPKFLEWIVSQVEGQKAGGVGVARWVKGIAFVAAEFPDNPELISEKLKGRLHWAVVNYTRTSYEPEKKVTANGREHVVRLIKLENIPDLVNLADFLQDFKTA